MRLTIYFPTILNAIVLAFFISPMAIVLSRRLGLIDFPGASKHKRHDTPTPMAGGLVIAVSLLLVALLFRWMSSYATLGILIGTLVIFIFGMLDDLVGFGAWQKLTGQVLATAILVITGTQVRLFTINWINLALTLLWVIGIVNAYNFVDSKDGLALGLAGIASGFFLLVTIEAAQPGVAQLSAGVFGICAGLFYFNLLPAKLFLGDSGAQQLGFLMAAIGVAYNPVGLEKLASWYVPIIVLGVPIFDTALVVFTRWRRGAKIYQASRDHTYHRLHDLGLESTRAIFTMHLTATVLGFISFIALTTKAIIGNVIFATAVLTGMVIIVALEKRSKKES